MPACDIGAPRRHYFIVFNVEALKLIKYSNSLERIAAYKLKVTPTFGIKIASIDHTVGSQMLLII